MRSLLQRRFYFLMSVLTVAVVLYGFLPRLDQRLIHPSHPVPFALWVHTVVFSVWILLLLVQSGLVQTRKVALHRTLGSAGLVLGIALPVVGIWVAMVSARLQLAPGKDAAEKFLLVPFSDMLFFAVFFGRGMWQRKQPEFHRRWMLLASVTLTVAAFARFPRFIVPGGHFNIACDLMLSLAVARDLYIDRRVHPAYLVGLPLLIAGQLATEWIRQSAWWIDVARGLLQ